ncbi:hypothetical protein IO43_03975 [Gallibacterium anatis 7990]|uniref:dual OB domain-containing protein n=1 Tax=Gallibacterium anatis TaxID=750 RepID=UPI000531F43C|nr:hypothetical protein [Gallibacterium anatis]KGQ64921.1 hypothetical protein IO43_03975 [Gallibacterium anatis 7990]
MSNIEDDVVILARTNMRNNRVCIGGFSLSQNKYVRLLNSSGNNMSENEAPYQIKQVYKIHYQIRSNIIAPHHEDVLVLNSSLNDVMLPRHFINLLKYLSIPNIHIKDLFAGLLNWEGEKSSGFLLESQSYYPSTSVMIAQLNHDLYLSHYEDRMYYFKDSSLNKTFEVRYVGTENLDNKKRIPSGTYIRFSLARWWDNNGRYSPKRSYLQLSGIY